MTAFFLYCGKLFRQITVSIAVHNINLAVPFLKQSGFLIVIILWVLSLQGNGLINRYDFLLPFAETADFCLGLDFFSTVRTNFKIVKSFFCPVLFK